MEKEPEIKVVQYLVRPGDFAIDIGANIGIYSKVLSELVGESGRLYSVEPFPPTFEILCNNIKKLHLKNVELLNVAISDSEALVTMGLPYDSSGSETHYRASIMKDNADKSKTKITNVQAATIDGLFLEDAKKISFIKCDVEGHELACINGAATFLAESQPAWLIEVSGNPEQTNSTADHVFKILNEKGYTAWWFDGQKLRKRRLGDKSTNYFFLRDDHIKILKRTDLKLA